MSRIEIKEETISMKDINSKMNGWNRLGVMAAIIWTIIAIVYSINIYSTHDPTHWRPFKIKNNSRFVRWYDTGDRIKVELTTTEHLTLKEQLYSALFLRGYRELKVYEKEFNSGDLILFIISPIIIGWAGIYFIYFMTKWVKIGFINIEEKENHKQENLKYKKEKKKKAKGSFKDYEKFYYQKDGSKRRTKNDRHYQNIKTEEYYYNILGLSPNFSVADIKQHYKELVKKYHPDNVNHLGTKLKETAEAEMKKINEAYSYFKDKYKFN